MQGYKTNSKLYYDLFRNKNIVHTEEYKNIFNERSYCVLVNPYKKILSTGYDANNNRYIYGNRQCFKKIINCSMIDDYIANKLNLYIGHFERRLKEYIGSRLADKFKTTNPYCNDYSCLNIIFNNIPNKRSINARSLLNNNYNIHDLIDFNKMYDDNGNIVSVDTNIAKNRFSAYMNIKECVDNAQYSNNLLIKYYKNNGFDPPIWLVVHTLSLGDLYAIFNMLSLNDRNDFYKIIYDKNPLPADNIKLSKKIGTVRKIRNNINHYEPILPVLIDAVDNNKIEEYIACFEMLKDLFKKDRIKNFRIDTCRLSTIKKNNYNKKYLDNISKIVKIIK